MSHVAVMYAVGRLLDSIRDPFNTSIIRAEMDLLRDREGTTVSQEDYAKWKKEKYEAKCIDPLVSGVVPIPKEARDAVPPCPYLCQLLFKSFCIGGKPGFWSGSRDMLGLEEVRNVRGRSGADALVRKEIQAWFLYIDVSNPLRPRYAFMEEQNIIDSTRVNRNGGRKPLYIFNAREHAYQLMIPEAELYSVAETFGEMEWERHIPGGTPTGRRGFTKLPDDPNIDPDYRVLLLSRMRRAQEHPAVIRMATFGWFVAEDITKPDGTALLQGIWRHSLKSSRNSYHKSVVRILLDTDLGKEAVIIRSQAMRETDHPDSPALEYSFTGLPEIASESNTSLKSLALHVITAVDPSRVPGGILALLDSVSHIGILPIVKFRLAQVLKDRSSKQGPGFHEEALQWLSGDESVPEPRNQLSEDNDTWLEHDYDISESYKIGPTITGDEETWWLLAYQAFCYRVTVTQERLSISLLNQASSGSISASQHGPAFGSPSDLWDGEFPGRPLGDVAHPAFDVSYFPRISEHQLLTALQVWSNMIWLPDLKAEDWDFDCSTPIPLRTLNVSGCHFVTRNTIRRALQIAPSITRIIMIGCKSFGGTDLMLLSLDGTLNNIECILTSETVRDPFQDPRHKKRRRDDAYNHARKLLPEPPNEKVQAKLNSVPGVFFNSTEEFQFQYSTKIHDTFYSKGLFTRSLSHSLARPPALGFDSATGQVVCGPPRFSIILATHSVGEVPVTGATLPHVPIDTGVEGVGTNGCGLTSIWRGIIDLLEFLGNPYFRNKQRWNMVGWSLIVKSCFSGPGQKWEKQSGLAGGGEFYGFPAYFKGGPGQANEEWIFAYQFRDAIARIQTYWTNGPAVDLLVYPESSSQDCWAFIRYGRDGNPLSKEIPTVVLYNVREFRQAICPDIPILEDEAKWMARVEDILANGTWHPSYPIMNWELDRHMARQGDPTWGELREAAKRMTKPKYMKDVPHELMLLIERMMTCQMNAGSDPF